MEAANLNALWGELIVEELYRQGVCHVVISPGSRSTPLTVAVARHSGMRSFIFHDERAGGFFALGLARATARPACLICTSGSAGAHYLPALVEAHMDGVPLLVLQADRPPELQETGANQTVPQTGMFSPYLRWQMALPAPSTQVLPEMILTTVAQAVQRALHPWPGPVHLNCPFREPLAPEPAPIPRDYTARLEEWASRKEPFTHLTLGQLLPDAEELDRLALQLKGISRGLVIMGRLPAGTPRQPLVALLKTLGWPVLADVVSGLRIPELTPWLVAGYDWLLAHREWQTSLVPELVLHFGAAPTSKRLLQFLNRHRPRHYVMVNPFPQRIDPNHQVSWRIVADMATVAEALVQRLAPADASPWLQIWKERAEAVRRFVSQNLKQAEQSVFSELHAVSHLSALLPGAIGLFLGSSMPIRDADMMLTSHPPELIITANRGASGIDGHLATAAGLAVGSGRPVVAFIGDLALLHDLNTLTALARHRWPVLVVVINNHGGGIFHFLPIEKFSPLFETYFATPHELNFAQLADWLNLPYRGCRTSTSFKQALPEALSTGGPAILEVEIDRKQNSAFIKKLIDGVGSLNKPAS